MRLFFLFFSILLVCGCSPENAKVAQVEVDKFHDMYQAGNYSGIYDDASNSLKKTISSADFVKLMMNAKNKDLGDFEKSTLRTIKNKFNLIQKNEVVLTYNTKYSKHFVEEIFNFEITGDNLKLKGYKYTSMD